jgi:flagellar biogenesis protein FliO
MNRKFAFVALILALVTGSTFAGVKVTALDLQTSGSNGYINISLEGRSVELPDLKVYGSTIEIILSQAESFGNIFKNVKGAQLSANVLNGKAIIKATLPYNINAEAVNLGWKNTSIEVVFPRGNATANTEKTVTKPVVTKPAAPATTPAASPVKVSKVEKRATVEEVTKKASSLTKEALNEDYLNKLMNENTAAPKVEAKAEVPAAPAAPRENKDEIQVKQAAPAVTPIKYAGVASKATNAAPKKDTFSFAGYAVKFTVFLAMVLGLFYGVVQFLKKGVFNRGKLGFLNNHQMIEVLSTTYVSPKKSLMIVKAHKQLFLVANSESGLQFLAEMKDTSGIIKEGEKAITGQNFDMSLFSAEGAEKTETAPKFTIKEDITQSTPVAEETPLSKVAVARDIVKFSDELKKKARKLKPIEFN